MRTRSHILLLNASPDESEMYAFWLETCGYRVSIAQTTASARRIARTESVDVLVIDARFGNASRCAEVARRWSRLARRECLPIVVLSGYVPPAGWSAQVNDKAFVIKPCPPQRLSGCIERLLSQ